MDLTCLGHACWLIEAAGLRLLCDPLLERDHYQGVFEVSSPRRLRVAALRPDFVFVSHAHPDHFDVPSLAALARHDSEAVVVTPDPLVAETARSLGFETVHRVSADQRIDLDGLQVVTTCSQAPDEWGLMIASEGGVVWNQIDSVFAGPDEVRAVRDRALRALGRERVDLVLAMARPMHEIAAQLGRSIGFPYAEYGRLLAELAAVEAGAIVPASADTAHVGPFAWLNHVVYPVEVERLLADAARVCPSARVVAGGLGVRLRVWAGVVERREGGGEAMIERLGPEIDRSYRPFAVPALADPGQLGDSGGLAELRARVAAWITDELGPALAAHYLEFEHDGPLRCVVELVYPGQSPGAHEGFTLRVDGNETTVTAGIDPSWDLYNLVAGTLLDEVIAGRRSWGELLLAGALRAAARAYTIRAGGLRRANVAELFVYYALPYDESVRRATAWQLARCLST
jgi:hypothetical protein